MKLNVTFDPEPLHTLDLDLWLVVISLKVPQLTKLRLVYDWFLTLHEPILYLS